MTSIYSSEDAMEVDVTTVDATPSDNPTSQDQSHDKSHDQSHDKSHDQSHGESYVSSEPEPEKEWERRLRFVQNILGGKLTVALHQEFLIRNNHTDLQILKNTKVRASGS